MIGMMLRLKDLGQLLKEHCYKNHIPTIFLKPSFDFFKLNVKYYPIIKKYFLKHQAQFQ